jgi:hypothetical protein
MCVFFTSVVRRVRADKVGETKSTDFSGDIEEEGRTGDG